MRKFIELNKGWKAFGIIVCLILGAAALFCGGVGIAAHCHDKGFVEEIQSWKQVEESVENTDENVENLEAMIRL